MKAKLITSYFRAILPAALLLFGLFASPSEAHASMLLFKLQPFTGDPIDATVTVDDNTSGLFRIKVQVTPAVPSGNIGDITGVFFDFNTNVALSNITVTQGGPAIGFGSNTSNLGGGVNLTGGGPNNPGLFDKGLRFAGFSVDDVQVIEFTIDRTAPTLTGAILEDFTRFALRVQTVGPLGGTRGGSSKLVGTPETPSSAVPEPSTLLLLALGLLGLAAKNKFSLKTF